MSAVQESLFGNDEHKAYKVLARKYRPQNFSELIGQNVMAQTFANAFNLGRLAHAYLLTGIRGVGKTTTARIFAKSFNCIGEDGKGNNNVEPCNLCINCRMISEDKHPDVREVDAASNTGVNDIRELIQDTKYRPTSGRYKIYIIDEVHMLSISAFNALLKTLEEPPAHVKFIFATTEFKKIPVTIVSRCQRFDLKRIALTDLTDYFTKVVQAEGFYAEPEALTIIANCAAGSVRDGLSLLDQALSLQGGKITAEGVRSMLGLSDIGRIYELYNAMVKGDIKKALLIAQNIYDNSGDPAIIVQELLAITYIVSKLKFIADDELVTVPQSYKTMVQELALQLDSIFLARSWQMLSSGLEEVQKSFSPFNSLEMLIIRIMHANFGETPESILYKLEQSSGGLNQTTKQLSSFAEIVNSCLQHDEPLLYHNLKNHVVAGNFQQGSIELYLAPEAPANLLQQLKQFMPRIADKEWTFIKLDKRPADATSVAESEKSELQFKKDQLTNSQLVQNILNHFTDAEIADIKVTH
jgi:DNA polymerase-3 subunit gamma/tau